MPPSLLADLVLAIHVLWVLIIVLGVPLILVGHFAGWTWVNHRVFRLTHLGMMVFVALEALFSVSCPLTVLETALREDAGQGGYGTSFIGHWLRTFLYWDFPPWVFTLVYVLFAILIGSMFWLVPIHKRVPRNS